MKDWKVTKHGCMSARDSRRWAYMAQITTSRELNNWRQKLKN